MYFAIEGTIRAPRCARPGSANRRQKASRQLWPPLGETWRNNRLDAHREACEACVLGQTHEGWTALPALYDDGGVSGGTMDRPALKRLLAEVAVGRIDTAVVYKVDRLTLMLSNRLYRGEFVHRGARYPGEHEPIIDPALWEEVQGRLAANRVERSTGVGAAEPSLLAGLVHDDAGEAMTPTHANKKGHAPAAAFRCLQ